MKIIWMTFILLLGGVLLIKKYSKKKVVNISLGIIIVLITSYLVMLSIDINRVNTFRKPMFMRETQNNCGINCTKYKGLGYVVLIEYYNNQIIEEITLTMFGKTIAGGVQDLARNNNDFTVNDETKTCDTALEPIYEDDNFIYSFPCIKSSTVYIIKNDGSKISVKDALKDNEINWGKLLIEKYPEMFNVSVKESQNSASCNIEDFLVSINSDKKVYKTDEKINIWITLKYIGDKDKLIVWHPGSAETDTYFNYLITDGKDFKLQSITNLMLKTSTLEKNKFYHYVYQKSGGFESDGPNAKFWEDFFKVKDLYLPAGEYTIDSTSAFGLSKDKQDIGLKCTLTISVIK